MAETPPPSPPSPLALALGRLPSGLFILTTRLGDRATGMLASWVQQAGFDPPMLTVALRRDRYLVDWIAETGRFTLNQVPAGQKRLVRHFARGFPADTPAFDGIPLRDDADPLGAPVLLDALSTLACEVAGALDGGDHRILLAHVTSGSLLQPDAEPMLHVRKNGLHY